MARKSLEPAARTDFEPSAAVRTDLEPAARTDLEPSTAIKSDFC